MQKKIITALITVLIFVQLFSFVIADAEYENHIFIIDGDGKTTYRYQYTIQITDYGMYLPAFTTELYVPEGENAKFFDNYGNVSAKKTDNYEGYDVYDVRTKEIEYNEEYGIGFQYVLDDVEIYRYKENYHFSYPIYDETIEYYVCIPDNFYSFPATYDNNPKEPEEYNPYYIPELIPFKEYKIADYTLLEPGTGYNSIMQLVDKCPDGYKEASPDIIYDDYYKVSLDYQNPDYEVPTEEYNGTNMNVKVPALYKAQIIDSLKAIDPILPQVSSRLDLDALSKYNVDFLSNTDEVFDGNFMVSFDDGTAFFRVDAVGQDSEFFQVNFLRGIINTALLKTYGEDFGNWWSDGALTIMAMNLMKENGLVDYHEEIVNGRAQKILVSVSYKHLLKA